VVLSVVAALVLMGLGLEMLIQLDQTASKAAGSWHLKQTVFACLAVVIMLTLVLLPYQKTARWSYGLFIAALLILAAVAAVQLAGKFGLHVSFFEQICPKVGGARRWIRLGPVQFQPSEFAKITYILALAWYLRYRSSYRRLLGLLGPFVVTLVPMCLILVEPDLGTVMLFLPVLFVMLYAAGAKRRHLTLIIVLGVLSVPFLFFQMADYQQRRVVGMLLQHDRVREFLAENPEWKNRVYPGRRLARWSLEEGYQLNHSKHMLGSGQLVGYGLGQGPYVEKPTLPHMHNDFIFAVIGHQLGFCGAMVVILAYLAFAVGGIEVATATDDPFGRLVAVGVVAMIITQAFINVGMTLGLMPVTGMTLPFVSYGGSSLVSSMILVGLLVWVNAHRPVVIGPRKPFEFPEEEQ